MTFADRLQLRRLGATEVSHDGKKLLFLSSRNKTQQIFVADFDSAAGSVTNATASLKSATRTVTDSTHTVTNATDNVSNVATLDAGNAICAPNGKSIVFTAQGREGRSESVLQILICSTLVA